MFDTPDSCPLQCEPIICKDVENNASTSLVIDGLGPGIEGLFLGMDDLAPDIEGLFLVMDNLGPGIDGLFLVIDGLGPGIDGLFLVIDNLGQLYFNSCFICIFL